MVRADDKPVASVRPIQSTPIPMMPRQVAMGMAGSSAAGGLPVNSLQKAGVQVQRIVTTTDIVIPGANSSGDVQARISAGESIHIIRGSKGTYIRTNDGRIFAIRSGKISRQAVEDSPASRDTQGSLVHPVSNGCSSPVSQQQHHQQQLLLPANGDQRSSSPLGSEILREISRYTSGDAASNDPESPPDPTAAQARDEAALRNDVADVLSSSLEMRGSKRRSSEGLGNAQAGAKRTSSAKAFPGLAVGGGGGLSFPPVGLNSSSMLGALGHMGHPLLMGHGAGGGGGSGGGPSFLQTPPGQGLADLQSIFSSAGSDLLRQSATRNGALNTPSSSSLPAGFSTAPPTTFSMSPSLSAAPCSSSSSSSASSSLPPYLLNTNMANLLTPGFPLGYGQSVLSEPRMFHNPLLPGSGGFPLSNSGGASSFLSHFNNPTSSLLGAALTQPDQLHGAENGDSSSDDDVIEVIGQ